MGRRFTAASNERIYIGSTGLNGFSFTFGTTAALVRIVSFNTAGTLFATNDATGASFDMYLTSTSFSLRLYDGSSDAVTVTGLTAGVTYLLGMTKASGTATPRGHALNTETGAWTHTAGTTTCVNSAANTSIGIGCYADSAADPADVEIFALGAWQGVVMTDSEFERLGKGRWLDFAPDFYEQFTDGRDVGDMVRTLGRFPVRQTARTGTTRGAQPKPPGVTLDARRRRR